MKLHPWHNFEFAGRHFVTVALDTTRDAPGGAHRVELRAAAAGQQLAGSGAPEGVWDLVRERLVVADGRPGPAGRLVVAAVPAEEEERVSAEIVMDVPLPDIPEETVAYALVPDLLPLVRSGQRHPAHLQIDIDRTGAEITVRGPLGEQVSHESVVGDHDVIHKVRTGEASQQRLQRRAEDSWQHNAAQVARQLDDLTARHHPVVVAVAGDGRAIGALEQHVSDAVRSRFVVLDSGGRAPGIDNHAEDEAMRRALDGAVAREVETTTARLSEAEGRQIRGAQGRDALVAAFSRGQVDTLLLSDPADGSGSVTVGEDGLPRDQGPGENIALPMAFAAAAFVTDADIVLVPPEMTMPDGAAAILRWDDESTAHDSGPSMPGHGEQPGWQP